jgi:hypothetical protein
MILGEEAFLEALGFLARSHGVEPPNQPALRVAYREASKLAPDPSDQPAALFYSLARRPKALRGTWRLACVLFARNGARAIGRDLSATDAEPTSLRLDAAQGAPFDRVRAWFAARLV